MRFEFIGVLRHMQQYISHIIMWRHRCAGELKKLLYLRSPPLVAFYDTLGYVRLLFYAVSTTMANGRGPNAIDTSQGSLTRPPPPPPVRTPGV